MPSPLFESTSSDKPKILTISFASDPTASLGAQLHSHDRGLTEDMFNPAYASIQRLLDGDTIARKAGVAIGDCIVAVNSEGFRRFPPEYEKDQLEDITTTINGISFDDQKESNDENTKKLRARVVSNKKDGEAYSLLLSKIKQIKKSADPQNPLQLTLERYGWDAQAHSFHRFLTARNGDIPAAMAMLQHHVQWKSCTFPIDLTNEGLQHVLKSKSVCEVDIQENDVVPPTVYVNFAKLQALEQNQSSEDVVKAFIIYTERMLARACNPRNPKTCQFIDLSGVSISRNGFRVDVLKQVYAAFEPNYPETLLKMVLYPVSKMVASTASMMLNFVNENTRKKFIITDDLERVCKELGWDKKKVDECGGVTEFIYKHEKNGSSLIFE